MKGKRQRLLWIYGLIIICTLAGILGGNRVITTISEGLPLERSHRIIIDAGHGGEDGGATSCTGKLESAFNLEISLRLQDLFHFLGYETVMVRSDDRSVYTKGESLSQKKISDLKERVRICEETDNGILLSIHQNHFSDSRYSGPQVFFAPTEGSEGLAKTLQNEFQSVLHPKSNRQIKKAKGIYLMEHIPCTGVLIECGFLSNPEEESKLRTEIYQKQMSCIIATAVCKFLDG